MTFFGEGSTANGQWHEAMNFAGIQRLPVVFLLENNRFAYSTPNELEFAVDPVERAHTYGFPGVAVDGNDVEAVFGAAQAAVERARDGGGPTLIECQTMRMHGHGAHDDMSYVPPELLRGVGAARPDRPLSRAARARSTASAPRRSTRSSTSVRAPRSTNAPRRRSPRPMPGRRRRASRACSRTPGEPLGDGAAPWSRWSRRTDGTPTARAAA